MGLSEKEVFATARFLYVAGHIGATYLIAMGLNLFCRKPALFGAFRANPDKHEAFVSELVRYDAPQPPIAEWDGRGTRRVRGDGCQGRLPAKAEVWVVFERIAARYSRIELAGHPERRRIV